MLRRASTLVVTALATLLLPVSVTTLADTAGAAPAPTRATSVASGPGIATVQALAAPRWGQGAVDKDHPFSDPIYYPLRQYMRMDCFRENPGCPGYHLDWTMTLSTAAETGPGDNAILAMGAGIFRFVRRSNECGTASVTNFGTTVEIDHGGGVVSRYGHLDNRDLDKYRAMDGQLVAAGDRIGTMGMTGAKRCGAPYLNVQVERNEVLYEMTDLTACLDGATQSWPQDQFSRYSRWNVVPEDDGLRDRPLTERSFFPRMRDQDRPADLNPSNAPDSSCLPTRAPSTPDRPAAPQVDPAGQGRMLVSWGDMPADATPLVRVEYLRRSDNTWRLATTARPVGGGTSVVVDGLQDGARHRVTLSYRNDAGWSAYSPPAERLVGDVPSAPRFRGARVGNGGTALRLMWYLSKHRGHPVVGYEVGVRPRSSARWSARRIAPRNASWVFQNLRSNGSYTVRVRALSAAGPSGWTTKNVATRR